MFKILVTGGSGFIGTNLISKLIKENKYTICNFDLVEPKIKEHFSLWKKVDLENRKLLMESIMDFSPDYVVHLAARTDLHGIHLSDYSVNMDGVSNLLEALQCIASLKRVIFTSSMYVCEPGYIPKNFDDYAPHTIYGKSKVETEKRIKIADPSYIWSIIRPTSIWGPFFGEPYDKFFKIILSRLYLHLGTRACKKTYGYIENTIYQIESILTAKEKSVNKKVFYLGDYEPYNITEWANEIAANAGITIPNVPFGLFIFLAKIGDILKRFGITFPVTSFRLKNMTTNNVHDLSLIYKIAPNLPVTRQEANKRTIKWIKEN